MRLRSSLLVYGLFGMLVGGCTRGAVPIPTFLVPEETQDQRATEAAMQATPTSFETEPEEAGVAVLWVPKDRGLNVRMPAGISGEVVRTLPWDSKGIMLSENTTMLGSSLWVEVILEDGTMGWVNAWNLTEYHPQLEFCNDLRPKEVLEEVTPLLASGALAELTPYVHENRGLTIRLSWSNPDVYFTKSDLATLITDEEEQDWGVYIGSDIPARGTFQEVIYPKLESVFSTSHQISCNTLQFGVTSGDVVWPSEFINLNFYSFYRSASPGGNVYDWRTWAIGIEYIDGEPFIAVLIHYTSEL